MRKKVTYSTFAKLRFMCHCGANSSCEWCRGKGYYIPSELTNSELERIIREIENTIRNRG